MSRPRYCFQFQGKEICIDIPVLYDPWWWLKKPAGERFTPDSLRVHDKVISAKVVENIMALTSINMLIENLPETQKGIFQQAIQDAAAKTVLPSGLSVHFDNR